MRAHWSRVLVTDLGKVLVVLGLATLINSRILIWCLTEDFDARSFAIAKVLLLAIAEFRLIVFLSNEAEVGPCHSSI